MISYWTGPGRAWRGLGESDIHSLCDLFTLIPPREGAEKYLSLCNVSERGAEEGSLCGGRYVSCGRVMVVSS